MKMSSAQEQKWTGKNWHPNKYFMILKKYHTDFASGWRDMASFYALFCIDSWLVDRRASDFHFKLSSDCHSANLIFAHCFLLLRKENEICRYVAIDSLPIFTSHVLNTDRWSMELRGCQFHVLTLFHWTMYHLAMKIPIKSNCCASKRINVQVSIFFGVIWSKWKIC